MKISFFIGSLGRGGAERVISILANAYAGRGWDVDIVFLLENKVEYVLDEKIRIVDLSPKSGGYMQNALSWLLGIRNYLRKRRPERVVSFVGRINALVLTAAAGLKLHVIVSERNDPKRDGRGPVMQWYCNRIYHRARAIVYQNEHERSCFDQSLAHLGCIIPNPVNVTASGVDCENTTVVTVGRLTAQKNQSLLIRAMAQVHCKYPEVQCRIYGEGNLRETLQQQIDDLGLRGTVTLEGNVADIHERMAQCGIFALTSEFEGLSNALIEAMMVGLPCITTDYSGARELITHEKNGLVVSMGDADELAEALIVLIRDQALRHRLAEAAREASNRYRADVVLREWMEVIENA